MHMNSFAKFDHQLLDQPELPLKNLLHNMLIDSSKSEALSRELTRVLEANRDRLDIQLTFLISNIVRFLELHASAFSSSDEQSILMLQ